MSVVTELQRHAVNLFHSVSKLLQKSDVVSEILMTVQKHLFKLALITIAIFLKLLKISK